MDPVFTDQGYVLVDNLILPPSMEVKEYRKLMDDIKTGRRPAIKAYVPPPEEPPKESLESQLETLKTALLEAKVLTPEQLQPKR